MGPIEGSILFCPLPDAGSRWRSFAASFSAQTATVLLIAIATLTAPQLASNRFVHIELVAPFTHVEPAPSSQVKPVPLAVKASPKVEVRPEMVAPPKIAALPPLPKQQEAIKATIPVAPLPRFDVAERTPEPARPTRPVQTNVFGSAASPTLPKMASARVQTGGFGDPNGVPVNARGNGKVNIASVGSFDLPAGPSHGNGTGGARGVRGTIASAGFGNGVAEASSAVTASRVQVANFDPPPVAEPRKAPQHAKLEVLPVSIQEKPAPAYTDEARKLHVEGEVLLQVVFTATGQVRVLRVVRGLGHGLDESAMRAAEKIHFSPARQEGRPVDSTATLHIVFQLS